MEQQQATATLSDLTAPVDVEQAEAAIVAHYPRLVRLAYLVLPAELAAARRVLTAHGLVQRALPRGRSGGGGDFQLPAQRVGLGGEAAVGYAYVRLRVLRAALRAARPGRRWWLPRGGRPLLPRVWGLRLVPRTGGADERALDEALAGLPAAARAGYALRHLEWLADREVHTLLEAAGVADPAGALAAADRVREPAGSRDGTPLEGPAFDPSAVQARPTDLIRRRQHVRAALVAVVALTVCGLLLGVPGGGWGPDGAAAPPYARNPAAERALDPAALTRAAPTAWRRVTSPGFSSWPARGDRTDDTALLRRALAVWARPGRAVRVSATPDSQSGPPAGPAQLLYAGDVDGAAVVVLYDGLRLVRYAEGRGDDHAVTLDFARADAADRASAGALVLSRTDGNVRFLTAPWVRTAAVRDLLAPRGPARPLHRSADGVTDPVRGPSVAGGCHSWPALQLGPHLVTDLGEVVPARLTYGAPGRGVSAAGMGGVTGGATGGGTAGATVNGTAGAAGAAAGGVTGDGAAGTAGAAAGRGVGDVAGSAARAGWARAACQLPLMVGRGIRSVNAWPFASQQLPEGTGTAAWTCTRGETWRGTGSRALVEFQPPPAGAHDGKPGASGAGASDGASAVVASADGSPACGPRQPRVLAGVEWKSPAGHWYVLGAGSRQVASITATGGVRGTVPGRLLALPTGRKGHAGLTARLTDGGRLAALH